MQTLAPTGPRKGLITFFVPRWIPDGLSPLGTPYKVFPVLSTLAHHGYEVDFFVENLDGLDTPQLRASLERADAAVAWCAELNPGTQIPGLLGFLELVHGLDAAMPRIAGGGFFALTRDVGLDLAPLADEVFGDSGVGSLARSIDERLGLTQQSARRSEPYDAYAICALDLTSFLRPEAMIFGNDAPSLQIPTGYGCSKTCNFCYYERTKVQLLPATKLVGSILHLRDKYDVRQFLFGELDFFAARRRALDVARQLVEREAGIRWFALVSIVDLKRLSDEELALLRESGCQVLELGTESGAHAGIVHLGKHFSPAEVLRETERLLASDIVPLHNMMLGFEGESAADRRATLHLIRELRALDPRVRFNFRCYQGVPNTTMGERVLHLMPPLPKDLAELLAYREASETGRSMPWLDEADEDAVLMLVDYLLPLAYDDFMNIGRSSSTLRRLLRGLARTRCRMDYYDHPIDRHLFQKHETVGLAGTYLS